MLFELYKMFYIDLYDNLILVFLIDNYFLYLLLFFLKKKMCASFSIRRALRLQEAFVLKCASCFYQHWF